MIYDTGPMRPLCTSLWAHTWFDDAPHRINPRNQGMELCVDCMIELDMGPEADHIDRILRTTMKSGEGFQFRCMVKDCRYLGQVLPIGLEEGKRRAKLHALTHSMEARGAVILTGQPEKFGDASYGEIPGDDFDYDGGELEI